MYLAGPEMRQMSQKNYGIFGIDVVTADAAVARMTRSRRKNLMSRDEQDRFKEHGFPHRRFSCKMNRIQLGEKIWKGCLPSNKR